MTTLDPRAVKIANEAAMEYGGEFTHEDTIAAAITAYLAASPQPALAVKGLEVTDRKTFVVPDGYEAVRDEDGRATGEVRVVASPPPSGEVEALREAANIAFDVVFGIAGAPMARATQQKILALSSAPATADGWRLVPVEPSREYLERLAHLWGYTLEETADNYAAILDALPAAPTATGGR